MGDIVAMHRPSTKRSPRRRTAGKVSRGARRIEKAAVFRRKPLVDAMARSRREGAGGRLGGLVRGGALAVCLLGAAVPVSAESFPPVIELSLLDGTNGFVINGIDAYDFSGRSVSGAGDVNGDGVDDLLIGAPYADPNGKFIAGESYVVFGIASLPPAVADALADAGLDPSEVPEEVLDALIAADEAGLLEVIPPGTTFNDSVDLVAGAAIVLGTGSTLNGNIQGPAGSTLVIGDGSFVDGNIEGVSLTFVGGSNAVVNGNVTADKVLVGPGAVATFIDGSGTFAVLEIEEGGAVDFNGNLQITERLELGANAALGVGGNLLCTDEATAIVDPTATVTFGGSNKCPALL